MARVSWSDASTLTPFGNAGSDLAAPLPANAVFTDMFYPGAYASNLQVVLTVLGPDVPKPIPRPTGATVLVR